MKATRTIVAVHVGTKTRPHAGQSLTTSAVPRRLRRTITQTQALQQALASSRQEAITARQQVALLTEANVALQKLAVDCGKEVTTARHFALHDELTGLPNRTLLLDRLNQVLARAKRYDKQFALLFLDLDRLKDVNDTFGHAAGDKLLQRVAERLLSCVRGGDTAVATEEMSSSSCCPRSKAKGVRWRLRRKSVAAWLNPAMLTAIPSR